MKVFTENALVFALLMIPLFLCLRLEFVRKRKVVWAVAAFVLTLAAGAAVLLSGGGLPELLVVALAVLAVCV